MTHDIGTINDDIAQALLHSGAQDASAASLAALRRRADARSGSVERKEKLHQVYIGTDRDDEFATALDACLDGLAILGKDGSRFEGRGIAVLADSGAGKTTTIGRALKRHPLFSEAGVNAPGCRAVSVKCLGSCTLRVLGEMLLEASGYVGLKEGLRENVVWQMLRARLKTLGVVCVHVDEVNNLLENSNADDHQRIVNNCKALINNPEWPVVLVISGTPMIGEAFRRDTQLRRRIDWMRLPHLQSPDDNDTLAAYVAALCRIADVAHPAEFGAAIAPRLVHASDRQLGTAAEIAVTAVERAIDGGGPLKIEDFATAFARRTGCDATQNPFVAALWWETDPKVALGMTTATVEAERLDDRDGPRKRSRGRRRRK